MPSSLNPMWIDFCSVLFLEPSLKTVQIAQLLLNAAVSRKAPERTYKSTYYWTGGQPQESYVYLLQCYALMEMPWLKIRGSAFYEGSVHSISRSKDLRVAELERYLESLLGKLLIQDKATSVFITFKSCFSPQKVPKAAYKSISIHR